MWNAGVDYQQQNGWYRPKPAGGGGGGPAFAWFNAQDNSFTGGSTSVTVGSGSMVGTNGAFTAGTTLLVQIITFGAATVTPPAGWTLIGSQGNASWYWLRCTGSETAPFTFTLSASVAAAWIMGAYSGTNASPIDGTPSVNVLNSGGFNTTTGSVTTTTSGSLLVLLSEDDNSNVMTCPVDMTSRFSAVQNSSSCSDMLSDRVSGAGSNSETWLTNFDTGAFALIGLK